MNAFTSRFDSAEADGNSADAAAANAASANPVESPALAAATACTLELLHFSDPESPASAVQDAPRMSAVLNAAGGGHRGGWRAR